MPVRCGKESELIVKLPDRAERKIHTASCVATFTAVISCGSSFTNIANNTIVEHVKIAPDSTIVKIGAMYRLMLRVPDEV